MARRNTPYNYNPYTDVLPERDTFFTPSVYERVGISPVEVYERKGKDFMAVESRKRLILSFGDFFKKNAFSFLH